MSPKTYCKAKRSLDNIRRVAELIEFKNETPSSHESCIQPGMPLQAMQQEQSLVSEVMSPNGQTLVHILHSVHFSLSIFNADLSSNRTHDTCLSISRHLRGQISIHLKHSIAHKYSNYIFNFMPNLKTDVAIIGAGPAGSAAANVIAEQGFDVLLIEKDEFPGLTNVCAGGTIKSVIKDNGLSPDIIEKNIKSEKHYFPWGENNIQIDLITVYRHVFDRCLAEKAVEKGAKMLNNTQIKDVSIKNDGAHLFSEKKNIDSKLVIFADGPNTLAYRKFGIGFKPEANTLYVSMTCEVKWENNPLDQCEIFYGEKIAPWGYGWIFPKRNTVNLGVGCLYSKLNSNLSDSMNFMLKNYPLTGEKFENKEILQRSSALIPAAPAKKIFDERMLVAGDAAGMVDPVSGGGIIHAINGGKIAGQICALSLEKGDFSAKFLSQYQARWQKTIDYSWIYHKFLVSNVFQYINKFDKNAYPKLSAVTREGIGKVLKQKIL